MARRKDPPEDQEVYKDFACRHGEDGEQKMTDLFATAKAILSEETDDHYAREEIADIDFFDYVVVELNWRWNATIDGIISDQWHAIITETYDQKFHTFVQCDRIVDGLAMTVVAYHEREQRLKEGGDAK